MQSEYRDENRNFTRTEVYSDYQRLSPRKTKMRVLMRRIVR